jgi:hypothetical protein
VRLRRGWFAELINIPLGGIMSGLIQSTSTEFFRGSKYFCIYFFFYNAANTARTGYIQFAGAQLQISVEIVQPLTAVNGGDRLTLNTDGTSTFHLVLRLQLLRSIGYEIESSLVSSYKLRIKHRRNILSLEETALWEVIQVGYDASKLKNTYLMR